MFNKVLSAFSVAKVRKVSDNFETKPIDATTPNSLVGVATVTKTISPHHAGRICHRGSSWPARCNEAIDLLPGNQVRVFGISGIKLFVEPLKLASTRNLELGQSGDLQTHW